MGVKCQRLKQTLSAVVWYRTVLGGSLGNTIRKVVEKLTCIRSISQSLEAQDLDGSSEWTQSETKALGLCIPLITSHWMQAGGRMWKKPETGQLFSHGYSCIGSIGRGGMCYG